MQKQNLYTFYAKSKDSHVKIAWNDIELHNVIIYEKQIFVFLTAVKSCIGVHLVKTAENTNPPDSFTFFTHIFINLLGGKILFLHQKNKKNHFKQFLKINCRNIFGT